MGDEIEIIDVSDYKPRKIPPSKKFQPHPPDSLVHEKGCIATLSGDA